MLVPWVVRDLGLPRATSARRRSPQEGCWGDSAMADLIAASGVPVRKTKSEMLFEGYLRARGYSEVEFEPVIAGTGKRPDYRITGLGQDLFVEVKEFRGVPSDFKLGTHCVDPYPPLREKIGAGRKKFKDLKRHCCCLVLHNVDKPLVHLDWRHVYGAMLGNLGFSVPIRLQGRPESVDDAIRHVFMSGGKMIRESKGRPVEPQNQTISAILVLGRVPVGQRLFWGDIRRREAARKAPFDLDEILAEIELAVGTDRDLRRRPLRVVVHENPFARIPLDPGLFRGSYDERYGGADDRIQRLYLGEALSSLPEAED